MNSFYLLSCAVSCALILIFAVDMFRFEIKKMLLSAATVIFKSLKANNGFTFYCKSCHCGMTTFLMRDNP